MSDLKLKDVQTFAKEHDVRNKLSVDEKTGAIVTQDDLYESTLGSVGVTLDQVKALQKHNVKLLAAVTLEAGELARDVFKNNAELKETSVSYTAGHDAYHAYFDRDAETKTRNVVESHGVGDNGALAKVYKHLDKMFQDLNK